MNTVPAPSASPPRQPGAGRALTLAVVAPLVFTVCFLFVYPPIPSELPDHFIAWPSATVTFVGFVSWIGLVRMTIRAFRNPDASDMAAVSAAIFNLAFLCELAMAVYAIKFR